MTEAQDGRRGGDPAAAPAPRYRLRVITAVRQTFTATELVGECGHVLASHVHHAEWLDHLVGRRKRCRSCPRPTPAEEPR